MLNRVVIAATLALAVAASASAQSTSTTSNQTPRPTGSTTSGQASGTQTTTSSTSQPASSSGDMQTRPATTTFMGDTGLWYVPTGEVLPRKKWSISAYRVNFDDNQGFSDISHWPVTFAFGLKDRAEIFGAWTVVTRVDRDIRPLFLSTLPQAGGTAPGNPLMTEAWSGN